MSAELFENLDKLETEELIYKINNSMFTAEAHKVALTVLTKRGVNVSHYRQESEENSEAETYGLETVEEKNLSTNSFINLFLVIALPLLVIAVGITGIHFSANYGFFSYVAMVTTIGIILKKAYVQMFVTDDKLGIGVKASTYGTTALIAMYFILAIPFTKLS